jgi:hypothetical protein
MDEKNLDQLIAEGKRLREHASRWTAAYFVLNMLNLCFWTGKAVLEGGAVSWVIAAVWLVGTALSGINVYLGRKMRRTYQQIESLKGNKSE